MPVLAPVRMTDDVRRVITPPPPDGGCDVTPHVPAGRASRRMAALSLEVNPVIIHESRAADWDSGRRLLVFVFVNFGISHGSPSGVVLGWAVLASGTLAQHLVLHDLALGHVAWTGATLTEAHRDRPQG